MKKIIILLQVVCIVMLVLNGCKTVPEKEKPVFEPVEPPETVREYNFELIAYDESVPGPDEDQRSYYKVFIDKVDVGRTTIGLESQKKYFEAKLSNNRHLLIVEKWVLNEKKGRYAKVNNIHQPRPNYVYFELEPGALVKITMVHDIQSREADFTISKED